MAEPVDPMKELQLRLEQAEREAQGDFSLSAPPSTAAPAKPATEHGPIKSKEDWNSYKAGSARDDDDDDSPNAQLNRQHNNLRAQAKIDQAMMAMLDTSIPRQDR